MNKLRQTFASVILLAAMSATTGSQKHAPAPDAVEKTGAIKKPDADEIRRRTAWLEDVQRDLAEGNKQAALADAVMIPDVDIIKTLLDSGVNPNGNRRSYMTPLSWAACIGDSESVIALLNAGADPNLSYDPKSGMPLYTAARTGDAKSIQALVEAGADLEYRQFGATPLQIAVSGGHADAVRMLIKLGADRNAKASPEEIVGLNDFINTLHLERVAISYNSEELTALDVARDSLKIWNDPKILEKLAKFETRESIAKIVDSYRNIIIALTEEVTPVPHYQLLQKQVLATANRMKKGTQVSAHPEYHHEF